MTTPACEPVPPRHLSRAELDSAVRELVESVGVTENGDLVAQLVTNALRIGLDGHDRGDVKLLNIAMRDLRRALGSFRPYRDRRKCSIFGSARTPAGSVAYLAAQELGAALAANDWMVITGGGPGIMTAGVEGAGAENSFAVTIRLPFEPMDAGGIVPDERLVRFRHFFSRKLTFMKESSAYVVFPGGFGTHDETFELLTLMQTGKEPPSPVVLFQPFGDHYWESWLEFVRDELVAAALVSAEDLDLFHITSSTEDAMAYIDGFYRVFHSMRYVDNRLIIRLSSDLDDETLERLNREFADILRSGGIERCAPTQQEIDDLDVVDLARIGLAFDDRHFGRLHQLVRSL